MKSIRVNFYLEKSKMNTSGQCPIWVRSRHNSPTLIRKSTGLYCEASRWDARRKLPKDAHLKNQVVSLERKIVEVYDQLGPGSSLDDVWGVLNDSGSNGAPKSRKVVDWIDYYLKVSPYSPGYVRGANLLKAHLTGKYLWKGKKQKDLKAFAPGLTFDQVTQTKVDALARHITEQGKSTSTVLKAIKFLKQVSKIARDEGVKVATLDFKAPKNFIKRVRSEIRLTLEEIRQIERAEITNENNRIVRDLFLLQCFTGLRHVDLMKLTPANVYDEYLEVKQQKTGDVVYPTLHDRSKAILNKYLALAADGHSPMFPQFTQQYYNRTLKVIGETAGLDETIRQVGYHGATEHIKEGPKFSFLTSHTGRRSFARLLAQAGVDEQFISEEMGHSTRSITSHYIGGSEHRERIAIVQKAWSEMGIKTRKLKVA